MWLLLPIAACIAALVAFKPMVKERAIKLWRADWTSGEFWRGNIEMPTKPATEVGMGPPTIRSAETQRSNGIGSEPQTVRGDGKTPADYAYNAGITRRVTDMAHWVGASVEGELGVLGSLESGTGEAEDGHGAEGALSHDQLLTNPDEAAKFTYRVGQFGLYSAISEGESTFCVASSPTRKGYIECTFRQAGRVTSALRRLNEGDLMGFRGPYGNSFPVESWKGKDLLFIAGGIALPPMRSVIQYCLDNRADYGDITIIYGARTWSDHVYKDE
jgi:hypothetical protein